MTNKKLVLEEKDGGVLAGISQKDCDPLFSSFPGTLTDLLMEQQDGISTLAGFVTIADTKWAANPKAPKYSPPKAKPAKVTKPSQAKAKPEAPKPEAKASAKTQKASPRQSQEEITSEEAEQPPATEQLPLLGEQKAEAPEKDIDAGEFAETPAEMVAETSAEMEQDEQLPESIGTKGDIAVQNPPKGYFLKDGSGPFADIQLAMDALDVPKDKRPSHKRYGRLSADLREKIIDRTVAE